MHADDFAFDLPQLRGKPFLTDGGLETTLIFDQGIDLPCFAAIALLARSDGRDILDRYFETYLDIARKVGAGFVLESPTWRGSRDWAPPLGLTEAGLAALNRSAIAQLHELRDRHETAEMPIVVSGCIGPRGDGYDPGQIMSVEEATELGADYGRLFQRFPQIAVVGGCCGTDHRHVGAIADAMRGTA